MSESVVGGVGAGDSGAAAGAPVQAPAETAETATAGAAKQAGDGIWLTLRETPRPAKALLVGVFVSKLAGFIQLFLVVFLTKRGFTPDQAGIALGCYGGGAVLGSLVGGTLTDRLSPRATTLISMIGTAGLILSVLAVTSKSVHQYILLLVVVTLVSAIGQLYRPAAQTLLTEMTPKHRLVMVTAMYRLGLNLGTTAAPLIGAALFAISYTLLFWAEAGASAIYAVIALAFLPSGIKRAVAPAAAPADADADAGPAAPPSAASGTGYRAVFADRRYSLYLAAVLLISVVYCQYTAALPLDIIKSGLSLWWYGAVVSLNGFIVVTCELLMTKVTQNWPLRLTAFLGLALVAVGYAVYAISPIPLVFILGTLIWTLSEIIGGPTVFAYPGMAAPERLRGRYIGAMQSTFGLGTAIGPILGVMLWYEVGRSVWLWAALVAALATVFGQFGMRLPHQDRAHTPSTADTAVAMASVEPATAD